MTCTALIVDWNKLSRDERFDLMDYDAAKAVVVLSKVMSNGWFCEYNLEAKDRNEVFEVLNIAHPDDYCLRSMSVGDIVIDSEGCWLCCAVGWMKLDNSVVWPDLEQWRVAQVNRNN